MKTTKSQLMALTLSCALVPAMAQENWLIHPAEAVQFEGEAGFMAPPGLRARAAMPFIDILQPESVPDGKLKSPLAIAVSFRPQVDAEIDVSTFKVLYGGLKFDITSRLAQYTRISAQGFKLENANIPKGKHRLTLQIQDTKQRVAERELRIEVE
ncbi:MAG: hypothetical protein CFE39_06895 [Comamonadaceae bacterium PBBC2]|nr:MAG: hypothetical protein CFE39_06895 [Comamonadaceae bacterium PBBC2]